MHLDIFLYDETKFLCTRRIDTNVQGAGLTEHIINVYGTHFL